MIIEAVRLIVTLGTTAGGFLVGRSIPEWFEGSQADPDMAIVMGAVIGAGVGYVGGGLIGRLITRGIDRAPELASRTTGQQLFAGTFGMLAGVIVGAVVSIPVVVLLPTVLDWALAGLLVMVLAAFGAKVFASRADDLFVAAGIRSRTSPQEWTASRTADAYVIDTSAAIDGRVLELGRARLISGDVWAPDFVIDELQGIADSGKKATRRRGRRGLDVLEALDGLPRIDVRAMERTYPGHDDVDAKLLALCLDTEAKLITTDHNLAKAAGLRGIEVLNPHALGESLRPAMISGEAVSLLIERAGSEPGQGIGFLDDGTMVVVEEASAMVGEKIEVEVSNTLRTSMGRLLFAKMRS